MDFVKCRILFFSQRVGWNKIRRREVTCVAFFEIREIRFLTMFDWVTDWLNKV